MNALKIDAMTAHWEFAYGPAGFAALAAQLDYPVLAANVFKKADGASAYYARIEQYVGTYSKFLVQREERESLRERESANFEKEIGRLERSMDKFRGANATHAQKRAQLPDWVAGKRIAVPALLDEPDVFAPEGITLTARVAGNGFV